MVAEIREVLLPHDAVGLRFTFDPGLVRERVDGAGAQTAAAAAVDDRFEALAHALFFFLASGLWPDGHHDGFSR